MTVCRGSKFRGMNKLLVSELMMNLSTCKMFFGFIKNFSTSFFVNFVDKSIHKFKMFIELRYVITDFIVSTYDIIRL